MVGSVESTDRRAQRVSEVAVMGSTSGDKPVDDVDNKVTGSGETGGKSDISGTKITPTGGAADAPGESLAPDEPRRGSDLAREALRAAQASAKARGRGRPRGSSSSTMARRRRRWSGPRPDDRDPQLLGGLVSRIAKDRGWTEKLNGGEVFNRWSSLVGPDVAEHTQPISLTDGELTVQADSTAWATQLRLLQRQLLAKIAAAVGNGVVKRLKVAGPSAPSWRHGNRHVPGRGPRDTYG
jgi:predicted nucleic acid-binding Zn ribbon protein